MWSVIFVLVYVCFLECNTEQNMGSSLSSNSGGKGRWFAKCPGKSFSCVAGKTPGRVSPLLLGIEAYAEVVDRNPTCVLLLITEWVRDCSKMQNCPWKNLLLCPPGCFFLCIDCNLCKPPSPSSLAYPARVRTFAVLFSSLSPLKL